LDEIIESGPIMIELGETRAHTYYQVGEAYYRKGDYENALLQYQKAVSINPGVIEGYINIFVVSVVTGNEELEQETVIKMLELNPDFFNGESILLQFVPMFKKVDRTDRVISDLKKLIVIDPNKIDYHTSLAIQYAELGRNNEAREAINVLSGADLALDEMIADFLKKLDSGELIKK
jgi:tetratricopeptide (TPR) repeat protein